MNANAGAIARVLWAIHAPQNVRHQPKPGDRPGDFSWWFDGGACQVITGSTRYIFNDGTTAFQAVLPHLHISIRLPEGTTVNVTQET
jgi:hypothetical protein